MTIEASKGSDMYFAGHPYSQFYSSSKNQFFAKGIYPFRGENETIEGLLMRTVFHETMQAAERKASFDPQCCVESFKQSGHRIWLETQGNNDRTYVGRQEHRISVALLSEMISHLNQKGWPAVGGSKSTSRPYIVHSTPTVNKFTEGLVLTLSRLFQEILGYAPTGYLPEEQIKLGYMVVKLLKISWSTASLSTDNAIWKQKYQFGKSRKKGWVLGSDIYKPC
jgi:hypothetical protein